MSAQPDKRPWLSELTRTVQLFTAIALVLWVSLNLFAQFNSRWVRPFVQPSLFPSLTLVGVALLVFFPQPPVTPAVKRRYWWWSLLASVLTLAGFWPSLHRYDITPLWLVPAGVLAFSFVFVALRQADGETDRPMPK